MEFMTTLVFVVIITCLICAAAAFRFRPVSLTPAVTTESVGSGEKARDSDSKSDEKKKKRKRKQTKKKLNGGPKQPDFEESEDMPDEDVAVGLLRARGVSRKATQTTSSETSPARQTRQIKTTTGQSQAVIDNSTSKTSSILAKGQSSHAKALVSVDAAKCSFVSKSLPKAETTALTMKTSNAARNQPVYNTTRSEIEMNGESALEAPDDNGPVDECALFIDDSNIFIEGQKYYA